MDEILKTSGWKAASHRYAMHEAQHSCSHNRGSLNSRREQRPCFVDDEEPNNGDRSSMRPAAAAPPRAPWLMPLNAALQLVHCTMCEQHAWVTKPMMNCVESTVSRAPGSLPLQETILWWSHAVKAITN